MNSTKTGMKEGEGEKAATGRGRRQETPPAIAFAMYRQAVVFVIQFIVLDFCFVYTAK
jgi:hypothetical protein